MVFRTRPEGELGLVSVIVPTHDRAGLISRALESVRAQTFRPIEVLIVDDGSSDETSDVVARWSRAHATEDLEVVYIRTNRRGAAAARNTGIERAWGSWVAFLDSDDWWEPRKLEVFSRAIQANPVFGLWYSMVQRFDGSGVIPGHKSKGFSGDHKDYLRKLNPIRSLSSVVVRRSLLQEAGGMDERFPSRHDADLYFRLADKTPFGFIPEVLVNYSVSSIGRISSSKRKRMTGWIRFYQKHRNELSLVERLYHQKRILYYALTLRDLPKTIHYGPGGLLHALIVRVIGDRSADGAWVG